MKYDSLKEYFQNFISFENEEWDTLKTFFTPKIIKRGEYLVKEGAICNEVAYINKGCLRYFHYKDGREITISFFIENEAISAFPSFLTRSNSNQVIDALEDSELITINYDKLQALYKEIPRFENAARLIIENLLVSAQNRLASYLINTPEERYLELVEESPHLLLRIPQHYIASYLGITPVSLSRIRQRVVFK